MNYSKTVIVLVSNLQLIAWLILPRLRPKLLSLNLSLYSSTVPEIDKDP